MAVSAREVAMEFVATKMALLQIFWAVSGTTTEPEGLDDWVRHSPVELSPTKGLETMLSLRADVIESEMWRAISRFAADQVDESVDRVMDTGRFEHAG